MLDEGPQIEMPAECSVELQAKDRPVVLRVTTTKDNLNATQTFECHWLSIGVCPQTRCDKVVELNVRNMFNYSNIA